MKRRVLRAIVLFATFPSWLFAAEQPTEIRFNRDIRPILSENCFSCHGPDSAARKAGLRLDTQQGALERKVILPGTAADSPLIARVTSEDPAERMPPPETGKVLTDEQQQLLARWIDLGAPWERHWSFIAPTRVELPNPEGVASWARNPIDHFVLEKLRDLGLEPNGQAQRHRLARRAALDLTGLPPSRELLESFQNDEHEAAYERYVDALLASTHAGEHRARHWLDAARYGDTHGMHVDNYREIWPYRDWVIGAFNENMPFDQFIVEQIAGDLLPNATLAQRIATGFNRCNITTSEGGAIPEELDVRYMVDRVETTATVFLGLTAGCAVCHDHKYDPISQREFYRLGAYFNNTTQPAMDGNQKDTPPVVAIPDAEHRDEWDDLQLRRGALRIALRQWQSGARRWWGSHEPQITHSIASDSLVLWIPLSEGESDVVELAPGAQWAEDHPAGRRGMRFEESAGIETPVPGFRTDRPMSISFWFRTPDMLTSTTLFEQTVKTQDGKTVGWSITCGSQGALSFQFSDGLGGTVRGNFPDNQALRPRAWQHVCVRYSGGQSSSSVTILVDGRAGDLRKSSESYVAVAEVPDAPLKVGTSMRTAGLSDVRIYQRWVSDEEVLLLAQDYLLKALLARTVAWDEIDRSSQQLLESYYDQTIDKHSQFLSRELTNTQTRHDYIYSRSTTTLVMEERAAPARAWVLERGEYDRRSEQVAPGVPAVLPPIPEDAPGNRLALAQWLVRPDQPLTARVTVNRLWQSVFGVGLVKTTEDFGVMGERPSHPELLDWLAVEFIESGWDVKHLLKLMVTSATYRQSSRVTAERLQRDPQNRFLSRGPRVRLDAEVLRDQSLAVSGLLRRTVGGPSVRPYQPAGLWKVVAITGSNTAEFKKDTGDALYRRSVYTFWKRTSPPPSMAAFNAPTREQCTVRRERTNTPLQALVLMNDPQFVESARYLAERALGQPGEDRERAVWMISTVLSAPVTEKDLREVVSAVSEFHSIFEQDVDGAKSLIGVGDRAPNASFDPVRLAAWTMAASMLMNRDDFINN